METLEPTLVKVLNTLGIKKLNTVQKMAEDKGIFSTTNDFALVSDSRTGKSFTGALLAANEIFKKKQKNKDKQIKDEEEIVFFITPFHASARDFSLRQGSPCIDKGTDVGIREDFGGTAVPSGTGVDMGAMEFTKETQAVELKKPH